MRLGFLGIVIVSILASTVVLADDRITTASRGDIAIDLGRGLEELSALIMQKTSRKGLTTYGDILPAAARKKLNGDVYVKFRIKMMVNSRTGKCYRPMM